MNTDRHHRTYAPVIAACTHAGLAWHQDFDFLVIGSAPAQVGSLLVQAHGDGTFAVSTILIVHAITADGGDYEVADLHLAATPDDLFTICHDISHTSK